MKYSSSVNNYRETPYIVSDTFANKVNYAATIKGAIYVARDGASLNEPSIFQANGTIWVPVGGYGIGTDATLQDVTTNGKTTDQGITVTAGGVSTNTLTVTSLTPKSIPFVGTADLITEDNTNLVWDNVNKWIGIQTNVPTAEVDIHTTTATPAIVINNTAGLSSRIGFLNTDVNKWTIGNSAANAFNIYNPTLATNAVSINSANNNSYFSGFVGINQSAPSYNLDVNGITNLGGVTNIQTGNNLFYLQNNGATTGWTANKAQNTGGSFIFGLNGSAAGGIASGATAYSTVLYSTTNLELYSGGVKRLTLDSATGDATLVNKLNGTQIILSTNSGGYGQTITNTNAGVDSNGLLIKAGGASSEYCLRLANIADSTTFLSVRGNGNVLINSTTDDTIHKLQVTGKTILNGNVGIKSNSSLVNANDSLSINVLTSGHTQIRLTDQFITGSFGALSYNASTGEVRLTQNDGGIGLTFYTGSISAIRMSISPTGQVNLQNVPSSSAGLVSGDIYKTAGALMIV
jgi:hypothetical protein